VERRALRRQEGRAPFPVAQVCREQDHAAAAATGAAATAREAARVAEMAYGHAAPRLGARIDPRALGRLVECAEGLVAGIEVARRVAERLDAPLRARVDSGALRAGALGDELRQLGAAEVGLRQELEEASERLTSAEVEIARIDAETGDASRRLEAAGEVGPAEGDDRDELAVRVERLEIRRATLGQVNPLAREEYEAEKERLADLKMQREDLERSLELLDRAQHHPLLRVDAPQVHVREVPWLIARSRLGLLQPLDRLVELPLQSEAGAQIVVRLG